jgi:clan AA aspartic protease
MLIPSDKRKSRRLPPSDVNPTTGGDEIGFVYAELQLISVDDLALCRRGFIATDEVRSVTVNALVDSGAYEMVINEHLRNQLDLPLVEERFVTLADETKRQVEIVGPLEIRFENRVTVANAIVLPGINEVLLGSVPMESLDVVIDPKRRTLEVNPASPDIPSTIVKNLDRNPGARLSA